MPEYLPLNEQQLESLPQHTDPVNPKVRFTDERGRAICITTGVIVQDDWIYYDRPAEYVNLVVEYLDQNNPSHKFRAVYLHQDEVDSIEEGIRKLRETEVPYL